MNNPTTVFIEVTDKCNKKCKHCFNSMSNNASVGEISPTKFHALIDTLKNSGVRLIKIVGGEPMAHSRIDKLIDELEYFKMPYIIYTDHEGILQLIEKLKASSCLVNIRISFDGIGASHDEIRVKGDFEKMCDVVRCLKAAGIPTYMNFTINKLNYRNLREIWDISKDLNTDIKFGIIKSCKSLNLNNWLTFSEQESFDFLKEMDCIRLENKELHYTIWDGIDDDDEFIKSQKDEKNPRHIGCYAGQKSCIIDTIGNIWPCGLLKGNEQFLYGNVFEDDFLNCYAKMNKEWSSLESDFICDGCKESVTCTGGCRANAFYAGSLQGKDPNCKFYCNGHKWTTYC